MTIWKTFLQGFKQQYVEIGDSQNLDASARLRVSQPKILKLANGIDIADRTATDTYTIVARSKGGSANVSAALRFAEIY